MPIKTMPLVKIIADFVGKIIHPTNNSSSAQYVKYGLTNSVFTCENDVSFIFVFFSAGLIIFDIYDFLMF